MNSVELGRRIKEARIRKKMTQSEVVGDFITRNMLSQIESGSAMPSVKTLDYLSRVLDIPLIRLMPNQTEQEQKDDALFLLEKAKDYLAVGFYEKIMDMEKDYPDRLFDEFSAIFCQACLSLARQALQLSKYQEAAHHSQKAMDYADKGIYANPTFKSESIMILHTAAEKLASGIR
jgi:transcriptional regulator with XRE-family HTH domain